MTRRQFLATSAAAAATPLQAVPPRSELGIVVHSLNVHRQKTSLDLLEFCHSLGAGGIQTLIKPDEAAAVRQRAEQYGMYVESMARVPRTDDTSEFEKTVVAAKQVGAVAIRTACLSGRRYETFSTLGEWKEWVAGAKAAIARAVPIVQKHKVALAIENHKDWTLEDQLALFREYESEYIGGTLDTGNNVSLLDHRMEFAEVMAPYAICTHMKDMAVEPYEDGFLLAEVPFGEGFMDMNKIADLVRAKRPTT
ncbi:MAG: sugar phosphate isomerase/epimerase, partial [bacterium]|nr:sugar phosphate isomerase/epimerase [bacterium]